MFFWFCFPFITSGVEVRTQELDREVVREYSLEVVILFSCVALVLAYKPAFKRVVKSWRKSSEGEEISANCPSWLLILDSWALPIIRHDSTPYLYQLFICCFSQFQWFFLSLNLLSRDLIIDSYWLMFLYTRNMFIDWAHFNGSDFTGAGKSFLKARVFLNPP